MDKHYIASNIVEAFDLCEHKRFRKKTFLYDGKEHTYGNLYDHMTKYTGVFKEYGITSGDMVIVSCKMDIAAIEAHLSLMRNGIISVLIDPETKQKRILRLLEFIKPKGIIADKESIDKWGIPEEFVLLSIEAKQDKGMLINKLLGKQNVSENQNSYPFILDSYPKVNPPEYINQDSDAYILFTSGTTALPKGVRISHRALFSHLQTLTRQFMFNEESRILNVGPLYHTAALSQGLMSSFVNRAILFRHLEFSFQTIDQFLYSVYTYKITHVHTNPTIVALLNDFAQEYSDAFQTEHLKVITCSGAKLPANTWQKFEDLFQFRISNFYGPTESVTGSLYCGPDDDTYKLGSVGKPVDCHVKIIREDGSEAGPDEQGELLITGSHIMEGYLNAPELNSQVLKDGWLYTGDIAKTDHKGYHYIEGRKKSIIITGGVNVMNAEVDEALLNIGGIQDAATFGKEDPVWGEIVVSAVVIKPDSELNEQHIIDECRNSLEPVKVPREIYFLDHIPRTKSGKVLLDETRQQVNDHGLEEIKAVTGSFEEKIIKVAAESFRLSPDNLTLKSDNRNLDEWDSLSHLVFISNLEQEFDVKFATVEIMKIESLKDAYEVIIEK